MMFGAPIGTVPFGVAEYTGVEYWDPPGEYTRTPEYVLSDLSLLMAAPPENRRWFIKAYAVDAAGDPQTQNWSQGDLALDDPFKDRAQRAIDFESSIFGARLVVSGISRPDFGIVRIERDVQDGTEITDLKWPGRPLEVYAGLKDWVQSRYLLSQSSTIKDVRWDESGFDIRLLDAGVTLKDPLQSVVYLGTGGVEGSENLTDVRKPFCFGQCDNITPRLVDVALDIYQVHDRSIEAIRAVYDGGVEITSDGEVGDVTAWTPVPGHYVTDISEGLIRLGAPPVSRGRVTADVDGDNEGSVFVTSTSDIVDRILRQRAGYTDTDISQGSFQAMNIALPGAKGIYSSGANESIESIINQIMLPVGFFRYDREGKVEVGNLGRQGTTINLNDTKLLSLRSVDGYQIIHSVELGYHRSWTVMGDDEILGAATDEFREFASQEYRTSLSEDAAVDAANADSTLLAVQTLFYNKADADNEAARMLTLMKEDLRFWEMTSINVQLAIKPGKTVFVTDAKYARTAMGLPCIVLRTRENSETNETEVTVWG